MQTGTGRLQRIMSEAEVSYAPALISRVAAVTGLWFPSLRILDLGCGPGTLARCFAPRTRGGGDGPFDGDAYRSPRADH